MYPEIVSTRWAAASVGREAQIDEAGARFADLVRLMADLRAPGGCPWDREQSLSSLRQYVREEAEEVCGAIDAILEYEADLRRHAGLEPADPTPPAGDERARTATKGLTIEHHPHRPDFSATASASGAPLPPLSAVDAARRAELYAALRGELGDLLLQSVFMGDILLAMGQPGVEGSLQAILAKLIRRHPHVYGDVEASSSAEVLANWEKIKQAERTAAEP